MTDRDTLAAIGLRIREARRAKGWAQRKAAREADVAHSTVSKWEAGDEAITACNLIRLADALGVPAGWLLTGERDCPACRAAFGFGLRGRPGRIGHRASEAILP